MKWGEIILLWVAGLWTVLVTLALVLGGLSSEQVSGTYFVWLVLASLPVWVICGLVWVTVYGRTPRRVMSVPPDKKPLSNEEVLANVVFSLDHIKKLAQHVVSDQENKRDWAKANFLKSVCTTDEIQNFANDEATTQQIRAIVSRLFEKLKDTDAATEQETKSLLERFYTDAKIAENAGAKDAVKLLFDSIVVKTYFVNVFNSILENATFFRDGVRMLRPLEIKDRFDRAWSTQRTRWERGLLQEEIGQKAIERFLEYFERMNTKAVHIRMNNAGYLPMSEALKNVGVADLLDRYQKHSILRQLWDACSSGLVVTILLGFFGIPLAGMAVGVGGLWMYFAYLFDTPRGQWEWIPSIEKLFARFPSLVDAPWKVTTLKWAFVIGLYLLIFSIFQHWGWHPVRKLRDTLYPHQCKFCRQRFRKEMDSTHCCLSSEPTRKWKRQHRLTSNKELITYDVLIFLGAGALIYFLWNYLFALGVALWFVYGVWKAVHLPMAACTKCEALADYYCEPSDILCSRCYARLKPEENTVGYYAY